MIFENENNKIDIQQTAELFLISLPPRREIIWSFFPFSNPKLFARPQNSFQNPQKFQIFILPPTIWCNYKQNSTYNYSTSTQIRGLEEIFTHRDGSSTCAMKAIADRMGKLDEVARDGPTWQQCYWCHSFHRLLHLPSLGFCSYFLCYKF